MPSPAAPIQNISPPPLSSPTRNTQKDTWYPYSNGTDFDSKMAMILIILICALVCALALNAAIRLFLRRSRTPPSDRLPLKTTHAAPATVISSPTLVFSDGMKLAVAECAICLSEFVNGEGVRILPRCKHGFHALCIEGWLSSHASCPTCRTTYLSPDIESPTPTEQLAIQQQTRDSVSSE